MPLLLLPLAAGALGFGGGFIAANGLSKLLNVALVAGAAYLIYAKLGK
jgi:hypothetical protein